MESQHWFFAKLATLDTLLGVLLRYFLVSFTFLGHSGISSLISLDVSDQYNRVSLFCTLLYFMLVCFVVYALCRIVAKKITNKMHNRVDFTKQI